MEEPRTVLPHVEVAEALALAGRRFGFPSLPAPSTASPLATVTLVKTFGGLDNDPNDYLLFRYASVAELDATVQLAITVASAWMQTRIASDPGYPPTDAAIATVVTYGEAYLALSFLYPILKARRVLGTHYPFEQQEPGAFDTLQNEDWWGQAQKLLSPYLTIEDEGVIRFAMPTFGIGPVIDVGPDSNLTSAEQQVEDLLDRARTLSVPPVGGPQWRG